jgi:hypothetical protein
MLPICCHAPRTRRPQGQPEREALLWASLLLSGSDSPFTQDGAVIDGPAVESLQVIDIAASPADA